ncbi:G-patch domain-containing protein [Xylariales sp. AK1849]|nr:G-patch domain-containing protein [Xylariales sp. AK1849]
MPDSSEEEDYMSMDFLSSTTPTTTTFSLPETSLQRRQRLRREGEIKGRPKSKAELAAEEKAAREQALATSLLDEAANPLAAQKSKGLSMMKKMGFAGGALGAKGNEAARQEPINLNLKEDRGGVGLDLERKRALDEHVDREGISKKPKVVDEGAFRERNRRERELKRWEGQAYGAQKIVEMMDEERDARRDTGGEIVNGKNRTLSTRPLKSINVLWRGLVRRREEAERERRMRYDMEQSLSRLPTYEDDNEDADDLKALGKTKTSYMPVEDLEEEDPELDEFDALEPDEKLQRLVEYLRKEYRYCFWCKFSYPDEEMDGCPGLTEEDHD